MKKLIKKLIFGDSQIQTIKGGIGKGLKMNIDVSSKAQRIIGLDEREIQKPFMDYAKKCNYFFDIGASDGYYSLLYRKYNPTGTIYMFEAQTKFKIEQEEHFKLNGFKIDYHHYDKFVSNFDNDKNVSVDTLFQEKNKIVLFKIDVDGGEMDVLNGMKNTAINNNCYFVIETHTKQLEIDCIKFLHDLGYKTKVIDQGWYRTFVKEDRPIEHNRWFIAWK